MILFNYGKGIPNLKGETKMNTFYLFIDYRTETVIDNTTYIEHGEIPLQLKAGSFETARAQALKIAQDMSRAFNGSGIKMYFRIVKNN